MLFKAGVPRHAIIKKFAGEEISCLEELISVISKLSRGARVPLEYISYVDRHRRKVYNQVIFVETSNFLLLNKKITSKWFIFLQTLIGWNV
jgi:hypothetical protein